MKVPNYFDDDDGIGDHEEKSEPRCKICGSRNVRWRQQGGEWVLFSLEPGKLHVCPIEDEFKPEPEQ